MSTPAQQLAAAAVYDDKDRLVGHNVINAAGHLVLIPRNHVHLAADVERGVYVEGLSPGQRLATPEDVAAKRAAARELAEAEQNEKEPTDVGP